MNITFWHWVGPLDECLDYFNRNYSHDDYIHLIELNGVHSLALF